MSRLRRLVLCDRYFFITCRLLPPRRLLDESDFECHARVIAGRRAEHGLVLTAFGQIISYGRWRLWKHLRRRSQRSYRPPAGTTLYAQMQCLGLIVL